ncbi:MAG: hypothetical protein ABI239_10035 [Aquihabitans sp.]
MTSTSHPLFDFMPPPANPVLKADLSWDQAESALRFQFSEQYKAFFDVYGSGSIDGELGFFSYRDSKWAQRFLDQNTILLPSDVPPLPMYPTSDVSLLPIGYDGNGYTIYAIAENGIMSDMALWSGNRRFGEWIELEGSFLDIVHSIVSGQVDYMAGPEEPGSPLLAPRFVATPK